MMSNDTSTTSTESTSVSVESASPWWETDYPSRYYAYSNTAETLGGYPVAGWVDVAIFSAAPSWLPVAADMIALTSDEWAARKLVNQIVVDGAVTTYTAPSPTLAAQAAAALPIARTTVYNNYGILNEATPDAWVAYLKALMAIANGTDTTSTALPSEPVASTTYTLAGASTATAGTAITLTLTPGGSGPSADTVVTISDGSAGGAFSSATVDFAAWSAVAQTVTYTPKAAGTVSISVTNTGSLTNPDSLSVTVSAAS